jgi:membrane-associated PAP2 superfamily phosphatase
MPAAPGLRAGPSGQRWDALACGVALASILLWDAGRGDLAVSGWFGTAGGFAWRHAAWAERGLHDGVRWLAGAALVLLTWDAWRPGRGHGTGPSAGARRFWWCVLLACLLAVPSVKRVSRTSCPWDLQPFGGTVPYIPHWAVQRDGGPGHCFPSGHAVSFFAFLPVYFLWRTHAPQRARVFLALLLGLGAAGSLVQVVRGAHFVSHVAWSAWACWTICALAAPAERRAVGRFSRWPVRWWPSPCASARASARTPPPPSGGRRWCGRSRPWSPPP